MEKQISEEKQSKLNRQSLAQTFSQRFCQLQSNANLTNDKMAEKLNISVEAVKKYRKLEKSALPEIPILINIATLFSVSTDYLLGMEVDDNPITFEYFYRFKNMADKLGFHLKKEQGKLLFECTDELTLNFLEHPERYNSIERNKIISENLRNELITKAEYDEIRKNVYLFSHNLELLEYNFSLSELKMAIRQAIIDTNTDEYEENGVICYYDEEYGEKLKHWNVSNGNPTQHISEDYYDLFGIAKIM